MKKIITLMLSLVLVTLVFAGCGKSTSASSSTDNSLDNVKKAGQIVIGLDNTYPPMEFTENGKTVGFDIDIADAVGKKLGVKVKIQPTSFDGIFLALQSKKFDAVQSSISITEKRKETMIFTKPYIYGGNAIFIMKSNTTIKSSNDLKGKVVGVEAGTTAQEVVTKIDGVKEIKKYNGMTEAFLDLQNGRIEAIVSDPQVGDYYIANKKDVFTRAKSLLNEEPEGVAFRKTDVTLRDAYQKALDDLKKDGTLTKISIKWFGKDIYSSK